jgi:hypothetical protein
MLAPWALWSVLRPRSDDILRGRSVRLITPMLFVPSSTEYSVLALPPKSLAITAKGDSGESSVNPVVTA